MLHNFMLLEMETHGTSYGVGRGCPIGNDGIRLQGPVAPPHTVRVPRARTEAKKLAKRRSDLAEHLEYSKAFNKHTRLN
jgi:hypothetical protein